MTASSPPARRGPGGLARRVVLGARVTIACGALAACSPSAAPAQDDEPGRSRLALAHDVLRFRTRIRDASAPQWLPDGDRFVYWAGAGPDRKTWVVVDAASRTARPLLPAGDLRAQLSRLLGREVELPDSARFAVAPGAHRLVFELEGRTFSIGVDDARVAAVAAGDRAALALPGTHRLSPDGRTVARPRSRGFAVEDRAGRVVLERAGEEYHEWELPDSAWSPDGRFLAVWRNDARAVHKIPIVDYDSAVERVTLEPYVKTGTPLVRQELHVFEPGSERVARVAGPDGESYQWLAGWRPDGSELLVLRMSRDGKRLDLVAADPARGTTRLVVREERPETFVAALDFAVDTWPRQVVPLRDGRHFLWFSERDGWRHVYQYDYSGKLVRQVTRGPFPVHRVAGVAPDGNTVFLVASADTSAPYDESLYRTSLRGGEMRRLTPGPGIHRVTLAPSGRYFVDGHSTRAVPRAWELRSSDGGAPFRYARADVSGLDELGLRPADSLAVLAADGTTRLYGVLYKPRDFDPGRKYPVIDLIYAGPFRTVVPWSFLGTSTSLRAHALAQMGFVVMVLDARGTPGRSKAFQDANYGRVGQTEIPDHVAALRQAAATRPYMDLDRVGIHGHSWGGYFALRGMLTAPDFFRAGYAGAPGALEEEAVINEPNLGLPGDNPEGYRAGSNLLAAGNLRGRLRIMHGTSDVNASLSTTMRMADALVRAGKRFELLLMPGETHNPSGAAGRYYDDDVRLFFARALGGPR